MSTNFISLEDAAKRLGVSIDELVEMRSRGDIFGYRDGASWKFKPEEIERVASELMGALDEDPAGSSILISESDLGPAGSKVGSTIGSDIQLAVDDDSDVSLVPDPNSGSDVKLVAGRGAGSGLSLDDDDLEIDGSGLVIGGGSDLKPGSSNRLIGSDLKLSADDDDDDELSLQADDDDLVISGSGLGSGVGSGLGSGVGKGSNSGSDIEIGSDISLSMGEGSDVLAGLSPVSKPSRGGSSGNDLSLSDDDDLVLGAGSDLALGNDSGINLMSPSDSGISLEDEPLDLAGSGISGLDLASEGSDAAGSSVSAVGSGIEIAQAEEFQLTPSGAIDTDDDSGSQVIELEDSSEFGDAAVALPAADGGFGDTGFGDAGGFDDSMGMATGGAMAAPAVMATPEVPFQTGMVLVLIGILMVMGLSGILVSDLVRNMWQYADGSSDLSSGFTKAVASIMGGK